MPVVGERSTKLGGSYSNSPVSKFAEAYAKLAKNVLTESNTNVFADPMTTLMKPESNEAMREFFVEGSYDADALSPSEIEDHISMMNETFINDRQAVLEQSSVGAYNPVIGMSLPMHKLLLMNCVFDKGGIPKFVAKTPKFTETMEYPYLVKADGTEINMFEHQDQIRDAMNAAAPWYEETITTLPHNGTVDLRGAGKLNRPTGSLSIASHISAVLVATKYAAGATLPDGTTNDTAAPVEVDTWFPVKLQFTPSYGEFDRTMFEQVTIATTDFVESGEEGSKVYTPKTVEVTDIIQGSMKDNLFYISTISGGKVVKGIKIKAKIDTSDAMTAVCSTKWKAKTDIFEIPEATPINVPVSPEEVKDVSALYGVNQLSKVMSMIKLTLENYKDDSIKSELDESFATLPARQKTTGKFDFAPRDGYALDQVEWRHKTFFDALDTQVTDLVNVWRDPDVTIGVFGRPDIIRKLTPTEYTYQTPANIGPVTLDYKKTVVTSDNRIYNFISSMKFGNSNELIIVINPRNTERFIYRIYDYQLYVSNEIRNAANPALPAVHAFERFKFASYQPVQGRIEILNPRGLRAGDTDEF